MLKVKTRLKLRSILISGNYVISKNKAYGNLWI